jgi:hypothetical protein
LSDIFFLQRRKLRKNKKEGGLKYFRFNLKYLNTKIAVSLFIHNSKAKRNHSFGFCVLKKKEFPILEDSKWKR